MLSLQPKFMEAHGGIHYLAEEVVGEGGEGAGLGGGGGNGEGTMH